MFRTAARILPILGILAATACVGTHGLAEGEYRECRKLNITGSKIAKEDCRTNTEWAKHDAEEAARNAALMESAKSGASPATMN